MKKLFCAALALLLLAGCAAPAAETTGESPYIILGSQKPGATTGGAAEAATTTPATTEEAALNVTMPSQQPGYLQKIVSHDQAVFSQPTYDSTPVGTVEQAGTYTILEEVTDSEGCLWGRLKSGAGWVCLTEIREHIAEPPAMTCGYASAGQLSRGDCHKYEGKPGEAHTAVIFHAYETLTDVKLFAAWWDGELQTEEQLYGLDVLDADRPLVANLSFLGDMTMFVLEFTDENGARQAWRIYESGRNGALEISPVEK